MTDHYQRHGLQMDCGNKESYEAHAVTFANTVDRKNCVSYKDKRGTTYKYNVKNNTLAIITKSGIMVTYFKPKEGKSYYDSIVKGVKKNGK